MKNKYMQQLQESLIDMGKMDKYEGPAKEVLKNRGAKLDVSKQANDVVSVLERYYYSEDNDIPLNSLTEGDETEIAAGEGPKTDIVPSSPVKPISSTDKADGAALDNPQQNGSMVDQSVLDEGLFEEADTVDMQDDKTDMNEADTECESCGVNEAAFEAELEALIESTTTVEEEETEPEVDLNSEAPIQPSAAEDANVVIPPEAPASPTPAPVPEVTPASPTPAPVPEVTPVAPTPAPVPEVTPVETPLDVDNKVEQTEDESELDDMDDEEADETEELDLDDETEDEETEVEEPETEIEEIEEDPAAEVVNQDGPVPAQNVTPEEEVPASTDEETIIARESTEDSLVAKLLREMEEMTSESDDEIDLDSEDD